VELIAAVYEDWGLGCHGTQPVTVSADRKFFREVTKGATVIVGRKTLGDFPGGKPLPNRTNVLLTHSDVEIEGAVVCRSAREALDFCKDAPKVMVIGGGSIYRLMLPYCTGAYITKIHAKPVSDTYLPCLDGDPAWDVPALLQAGEENGIRFEMYHYLRKEQEK